MSNNLSTKDSRDDDDDDDDMKPEGGGDNVDQDRSPSVFTDTKTNEIFEQRFIGSASSRSNEEFQSVVKNVSDEEYLMQCLEILNKMEEIDDDSYSKALKLFHGDATWRKIFVVMPCKRRKNFILKL
ncbi:hypothetical protein M0R45_034972 [Rubus argutus]|uniref:Uncharacterized protein n=1 Tax=Rubus argutus TaxID=59490 RepID=A0AAW1VW40_RUBAR